jgi:hypothetical protein
MIVDERNQAGAPNGAAAASSPDGQSHLVLPVAVAENSLCIARTVKNADKNKSPFLFREESAGQ